MNSVCLVGRLVADPDYNKKKVKGSDPVEYCRFRMAVKRPFSKDTTDFINCVCFRNANVINEYVKKGDMLAINGILQVDQKKDEETGEVTYYTSVNVQTFTLLPNKSKER